VSRYVAQAVEAEERREALRVWLADQNADHGPVSAETLEEVRREWLGAARGAS
jgi:hypothetical protein